MHRGFFDDADLVVMLHTGGGENKFWLSPGQNGCLTKGIAYHGLAAHAGGSPHAGINSLYAANLGMNAINALSETFRDEDHIRYHPIITGKIVTVTEAIRKDVGGRVDLFGVTWKAVADTDIPAGANVRVTGKQNLTLTVSELK